MKCKHQTPRMVFFEAMDKDDTSVLYCLECRMGVVLTADEEKAMKEINGNMGAMRKVGMPIFEERKAEIKLPDHWEIPV